MKPLDWLRRFIRPAGKPLDPEQARIVGPVETRKLRVEIPDPKTGYSGRVTDDETGQVITGVRSLDIHLDSEDYTPVLTLEIHDCGLLMVGTFRCELIKEDPL